MENVKNFSESVNPKISAVSVAIDELNLANQSKNFT